MASILVLGGARSGKSRRALALAEASGATAWTFVATAEPLDDEMAERVARHRDERDARWTAIEEPLELARTLRAVRAARAAIVVDCLTLWLSNLMHRGRDPERELPPLIDAIACGGGELVLVSNEVGLGLVPETPLGRDFRDAQGRLNQAVAAACDRVEFVAAGLPLPLKGG